MADSQRPIGLEGKPNPLLIPELADHCIEFLHDSPSALKACALVARSWTYAAQVHLFSVLCIRPTSSRRRWTRLRQILRSSPRFIRHIRQLRLDSQALSTETFSEICEFAFTHLEYACIRHPTSVQLVMGVAVRQLFRLPTLTRVKLVANFTEPSSFLQMWEYCCPSIRHVDLFCFDDSLDPVRPVPDRPCTAIMLESLNIRSITYLYNWFGHDLCPFNLSRLKVLSMSPREEYEEIVGLQIFAPALRTIEVLNFSLRASDPGLDLAALPNLVLLRMGGITRTRMERAVDTLSTIAPPSRVRKIVLHSSSLDEECCGQLEAALTSLPLDPLPTLEMEMDSIRGGPSADNLDQYFPRLSSMNLLRPVDGYHDWFENFGGI
ncbi:hypothetical protein FB451DRAFT_1382994 [Mycena latifolia]|nr:hypothetical protein FB451DRAFT_1382994 [Mycena latifolia]